MIHHPQENYPGWKLAGAVWGWRQRKKHLARAVKLGCRREGPLCEGSHSCISPLPTLRSTPSLCLSNRVTIGCGPWVERDVLSLVCLVSFNKWFWICYIYIYLKLSYLIFSNTISEKGNLICWILKKKNLNSSIKKDQKPKSNLKTCISSAEFCRPRHYLAAK